MALNTIKQTYSLDGGEYILYMLKVSLNERDQHNKTKPKTAITEVIWLNLYEYNV